MESESIFAKLLLGATIAGGTRLRSNDILYIIFMIINIVEFN